MAAAEIEACENVTLYTEGSLPLDNSMLVGHEPPKTEKKMKTTGTTSEQQNKSESRSVKLNNIQDSSRSTPRNETETLRSNIPQKAPNHMVPTPVIKIGSTNRNLNTMDNSHQTSMQQDQPELHSSQQHDTETDAKPLGPDMTGNRRLISCSSVSSAYSMSEQEVPDKNERKLQFEGDILRPKDFNDQRLNHTHLVDIVIVFAKSDYELACEYKGWLHSLAEKNQVMDIKIELYTSEHFPANDVKVVEEVVNRSMRVLMLLSVNFEQEVSLTFIKEETIGLTRLQEYPEQEKISLYATCIMNRKKNCVRPVHTCQPKQRYYRTPAGLSALRAFSFFEPNKNSKFENDTVAQFLKSAREDREYHMKEMQRHQATDNLDAMQAVEQKKSVTYYNDRYGASPHVYKSDNGNHTENNTFQSMNSGLHRLQANQSSSDNKSMIVGPPKHNIEKAQNVTSSFQQTSMSSSGNNTESHYEEVFIGKMDSMAQNMKQEAQTQLPQQSSNNKLPAITADPPTEQSSLSTHLQQDGYDSLNRQDAEEDAAGKVSMKSYNEKEDSTSLMKDSLMLDDCRTGGNTNQKSSETVYNTKIYPPKNSDLYDGGKVKEHILSYTGSSGRSGIRSGANPEYVDYMSGVPVNGQRTDTSDMPHYVRPSPTPLVVPAPQSVHYHYYYSDSGPTDDDPDQGPPTSYHIPPNRRPPSSSVNRPRNPPSPPPTRSGPIFNIQGCAMVQIGDSNRVIGNQTVESSTNIGSDRNSMDRSSADLASRQGDTGERYQSYGSQPEQSLNVLSPVNNPAKPKNIGGDDSSDESNDDNSNPRYRSVDSEDMFGNGQDLSGNLSSSFTAKGATFGEKNIFDEKMLGIKSHSLDKDESELKNSTQNDDVESCLSISIELLSNDSATSSTMTSLVTHLRSDPRKRKQCTQYHYNQNVKRDSSDNVHCDDDVD